MPKSTLSIDAYIDFIFCFRTQRWCWHLWRITSSRSPPPTNSATYPTNRTYTTTTTAPKAEVASTPSNNSPLPAPANCAKILAKNPGIDQSLWILRCCGQLRIFVSISMLQVWGLPILQMECWHMTWSPWACCAPAAGTGLDGQTGAEALEALIQPPEFKSKKFKWQLKT